MHRGWRAALGDICGLDDCGEKSHAELSSMTVEELRKWQAEVNQARSDIYCGPVDEHMLERKERTEVSLCLAVCLCLGVEASLCVCLCLSACVCVCLCLCLCISGGKVGETTAFRVFDPPAPRRAIIV